MFSFGKYDSDEMYIVTHVKVVPTCVFLSPSSYNVLFTLMLILVESLLIVQYLENFLQCFILSYFQSKIDFKTT